MSAATSGAPVIQLPLFDFEGPLELLLSLVERRRLPIEELSLALVADQYLAHVRSIGPSQEALSDFLLIGARLVLIKSRALLPRDDAATDLEEESADDLVRRLEAYRAFRALAAELGRLDQAQQTSFRRGAIVPEVGRAYEAPLEEIAASLLASLLRDVETRIAAESPREEARAPQVAIADRLSLVRSQVAEHRRVQWSDVAGVTIPEIVATFLAVLEMVRQGEIQVEQPTLFGPIVLVGLEPGTQAADGVAPLGEPELAQQQEIVLARERPPTAIVILGSLDLDETA